MLSTAVTLHTPIGLLSFITLKFYTRTRAKKDKILSNGQRKVPAEGETGAVSDLGYVHPNI